MWDYLLNKFPTTSSEVKYGTPEMADEIKRIISKENFSRFGKGIIIMGGHEEGIVAFGKNLDEAGELLTKAYDKIVNIMKD
jgi:hypothetical protein